MPVVSISTAFATEGDALYFTVTLDEAAFDVVTVNYQTVLGTANNSDLYYAITNSNNRGTLTFAPGETSKTLTVYTRSDSDDERDENIMLRLSGLSENASFASGEDIERAMGIILDNDGQGSNLALLVSDAELVEGDGGTKYAEFDLVLSRPADESFSVSYRTRDISATAGEDYAEWNGSARFAVGDQIKTVRVPVYGDNLAEVTESFALVVTDPGSPNLPVEGLVGEAVIRDDDTQPQPVVSISAAKAVEGEGLVYTVTLSEPTFDAVTMTYRAVPGTASDGDLYYSPTSSYNWNTLTFAPGETSRTVTIYTERDSTDERDESVVLHLSGLTENASFAGGEEVLSGTGIILDNDGTGSDLALLVSDVRLVEGDSGTKEAVFEIRLSQPAPTAFSVGYRTRDISATAGEDYEETVGSLSFAEGEEVKVVRVPVYGDTVAEMTESFALVIDEPTGLSVATTGLAGEATIADDDNTPGPVVSVSVARATEGEALIYTVTLSEPAGDEVALRYQSFAGTADEADLDYDFESDRNINTLSFAPGQISKTIIVYTERDSTDERDESIGLRLYNLTENASFAGGEDQLFTNGVILDNDGVGGNMTLLVSGATLLEGDDGTKEAVFELRLSQPASEAILLTYSTRDITAKAGEDYEAAVGTVSFAVGEEVKVVRVPVYGDTEVEFTERFGLRVDASAVPYLGIENVEAEAVIRDDDTTPNPVITVSPATATEGDALLFTLTLSEPSDDAVTVDYKPLVGTADENDLYYSLTSRNNTGTLTFEPGQTSKTVIIHSERDSIDERDEVFFMEFSNVIGASLADGAPSVSVSGTILDDDGVGLNRTATVQPMVLREHGVASFIYEIPVELSTPASAPLSFNVEAIDQTALAGLDYRLLDTRLNFAEGQSVATITIEVLGDSSIETTEAFTLSLEPVAGTPYAGSIADTVIYIRPGPLLPSPQDDVLVGTVGDDLIDLLAGSDHYRGLEGNDTAFGNHGADTIIGGAGSDRLNGGPGADLLIGGEVEDVSTTAGAQVYRLYQATLDRLPDTQGYDNWSARIDSGEMTLLQVIGGFVNSPEFQSTYGALNNRAFVELLYLNVLGREADATGLANWTARLDSGTSREQVVLGFAQSAEFIDNTNEPASAYVAAGVAATYADDVFRIYQATLDRAPDLNGLMNWSARLGEGTEILTVISGFVNSTEFQSVYGNVSNTGFVTLLYNNVLGRDPDANGLANWTQRLEDGMSREAVVLGFAASAEFIAKTETAFMTYMRATEGDSFRGGPDNDLIYGGMLADEFAFDVSDKGRDRVLELDAWDTLSFSGFGYADADDARSHMTEVGKDLVFADQGVSVVFMRADLETVANMEILV
ncbi:DUF4214 domain-containing protein [Salipiger sp. P9]|uniref:Calx-beta domain-containing protein n=1 Tax=Salipiger pentaromativorans TaxID=2943193 RepID=UPI002156F7A3|nr:Calx-beta domain-containing protein [Salipiger pentaromativorans]MCR8549175.1 DUF4214 domain-containing protein [Salipiger pentaromativorans]